MSNALASTWRRYRALPALPRELATLGMMLLLSLTLLPVMIFIAGQIFLGDYVRDPSGAPTGGLGAFWTDFLQGLGRFSFGYWLVLLGPWLLLLAVRGIVGRATRGRSRARSGR